MVLLSINDGLEAASELKRIDELEQQLSEYKTMVAEPTYDNQALKNLIEKSLASTDKQDAVDYLVEKRPYRVPGRFCLKAIDNRRKTLHTS